MYPGVMDNGFFYSKTSVTIVFISIHIIQSSLHARARAVYIPGNDYEQISFIFYSERENVTYSRPTSGIVVFIYNQSPA